MRKTLLLTAIFSVAILPFTASAQTAPASNCTPSSDDLAAIQAIQNNPNLTPSQELSQELALRKQLLSQTISCAVSETKALQQTLNNAPSTNGTNAISSQLSGELNDALNFYQIESNKLTNAGISATEAIAKEVLAWRAANYEPLAGNVNNFILWSNNQALFGTAQNRLAQTQQVVNFIENAAAENDLSSSFNAAQMSLENALSQNSAAENALAQSLPPDQSLALIQQSLQALADTYQKFSDLNNLIQKLLPTSQ